MSRKLVRKGIAEVIAVTHEVEPVPGAAIDDNPLTGKSIPIPDHFACDVARIDRNPQQPRRVFRDEDIESLARSLKAHGLKQPVGVRKMPAGRFQLVWGERRLRAAERLGWPTIHAVMTTGDDAEISIIENLQRVDLNCFEEAHALNRLRERRRESGGEKLTYETLAALVGKSRSEIGRLFSLLDLPDSIRQDYESMDSAPARGHVYALADGAGKKTPEELWTAWLAVKTGHERRKGSAEEAGSVPPTEADDTDIVAPKARRMLPVESGLPQKIATKIYGARATLIALEQEPRPLWRSDVRALKEMRDAIDRILAASTDDA